MELPFEGQICAPTVISDTADYLSPIDGRLISGRAQRREDLKRNDCVEYEPTKNAPTREEREYYTAFHKERQRKKQEQSIDR